MHLMGAQCAKETQYPQLASSLRDAALGLRQLWPLDITESADKRSPCQRTDLAGHRHHQGQRRRQARDWSYQSALEERSADDDVASR